MSAWSVKTRRAPSLHYTDARVYVYTTTALHDMSTLRNARAYGYTITAMHNIEYTPLSMTAFPCFVDLDGSVHNVPAATAMPYERPVRGC